MCAAGNVEGRNAVLLFSLTSFRLGMTSVVSSPLGMGPSVDNWDTTKSRVGTGCSILARWGAKCESNVCRKGLHVARNEQHLGRNLRVRTDIP
jgi:hypothetical protein